RRAVAEQASAAAGAADLGGRRPRGFRAGNQVVDCGSGHAGGQTLAIIPLLVDLPADLAPVAPLERGPQRHRRVADPFEAVEDVGVTVDVALGDLPVVGARVSR